MRERRADPRARADARRRRDARAARPRRPARCSAPGPGRLCQALGITREHDGLPLDRPPFELRPRENEPEIVARPADRDHEGGRPARGATAWPARRFLSRAATTTLTVIPGRAASPRSGSARRLAPAARPRSPRRRQELDAPKLRPRVAQRQPDELRDDAELRLGEDERDVVVRREPAARRHLRDHDVDALQRLRRLVRDRPLERLGGEARLRDVERLADHARHLDLVRLAVRGPRRAAAGEVDERLRALAEPVVEQEPAVAADDALRRAGEVRRRLEVLGLVSADPGAPTP